MKGRSATRSAFPGNACPKYHSRRRAERYAGVLMRSQGGGPGDERCELWEREEISSCPLYQESEVGSNSAEQKGGMACAGRSVTDDTWSNRGNSRR